MADYLATHESDFAYVLNEINEKLETLRTGSVTPADVDRVTTSFDDGFDEALSILERMSSEVQSLPTAQRSQYNTKIRAHRNEIEKAKREMRKLADNQGRQQLFGDRSEPYADEGSSQRQQLLSSQQRLERSSDRLRDAQRVGNETEAIGAGILTDLRGQREQIENSRNTLTEADSYVDKSLRTLRSMARRMAANRLISYAIIAVLVVLIVFVLASKFM